MNDQNSELQAGWYRVPGEVSSLRFWDGTAWTEHRAPEPFPSSLPTVVTAAAAFIVAWGVLGVVIFIGALANSF